MASTIVQQNAIPIPAVEGANPSVGAESIGTVIRLILTDDNIANVVAAGMVRLVIERSIDGGLSYTEVTEPDERPKLDKDKPVMEFFDRCGDATYFYRFRYAGTLKGKKVLTAPSEAIEGIGLAIRGVLTVEQLKARGHIHSSFTMVDVVITSVSGRVQMAHALRQFAGLPPKGIQPGRPASRHRIAAAAE